MEAQRDRHQLQAVARIEGQRASGEEGGSNTLEKFLSRPSNGRWKNGARKLVRIYIFEIRSLKVSFHRFINFSRWKRKKKKKDKSLARLLASSGKHPILPLFFHVHKYLYILRPTRTRLDRWVACIDRSKRGKTNSSKSTV